MATETEKVYTDTTTAPVAESASVTTAPGTTAPVDVTTASAPATTATATTPYVTGNESLDKYNNSRVEQINQMYNAQRDSALGQLESAHNRVMSDAQAAYDKITPKYQESRNAVSAEYERQRRNNNLQAAANGLNTGAGSQMQLAQSSVNQANQTSLQKAENEALNEANRNMLTMKEQYQADVSKALADNDNTRAAALLNEYAQQYDRMMTEAKQLAAYGDFSLYTPLYGETAARQMEQTWLLQNPNLAYTLGKITADQFFNMTGDYPPDVKEEMKKQKNSGYYGGSSSKKKNSAVGTYVALVKNSNTGKAIKDTYTVSKK